MRLGIAAARSHRSSCGFLVGSGVVYLMLWLYGTVVKDGSRANFVPLDDADNWLHLVLGAGMLGRACSSAGSTTAVPAGGPMPPGDRPTQLILVRHGQSEGNVAAEAAQRDDLEHIDVPARDADVTLSAIGRDQSAAVGRWLRALDEDERPEVLWTSPYRRARETAEIALEVAGLELDQRVDERLRDRDMGVTDKLTAAGIRAAYPTRPKDVTGSASSTTARRAESPGPTWPCGCVAC